jgi:hypothetical protein
MESYWRTRVAMLVSSPRVYSVDWSKPRMDDRRRTLPAGFSMLLGSLLLLGAITSALFFLRGTCPNCQGYRLVNYGIDDWWTERHGLPRAERSVFTLSVTCSRCSGSGKVPLVWTWIEIPPIDVSK